MEPTATGLPSAFWGEAATTRLCYLCNVADESELPPLWSALVADGAKHDRRTLEQAFAEVAKARNWVDWAPIATLALPST